MKKNDSSRQILISLEWQQYIYGVSYPLLATNKPFIGYGKSIWLDHFTQLLHTHKIHNKLKSSEPPVPQREKDVFITDIITKNISSKIILQRLNACRLFLQVTLLSKIGSANRKFIKHNILQGKRNSIDSI